MLDSLTDYEKARDGIEEFLKKPFFIENEKVSFHAAICGIMNAEKLEKEDSILSYIEYMISLISEPSGYGPDPVGQQDPGGLPL